MTAALLGFAEYRLPASALAKELGLGFDAVTVRSFPDGESLVRVGAVAETVLLYRSLDNPNAKLIELLLAASAARDCGARRVVLVAPYLAYMRQDMAFHAGEAVSQQVVGKLITGHFDGLVTIDPHLHRISALGEAVPGIPAISLSAGPVLSAAIDARERPVLIGPDSESQPWVEAIARPLGLEVLLGEKRRHGDRDVDLDIVGVERVAGRKAVLVDDVISSGATMIAAANQLLRAGAVSVEALATHCLASAEDIARMQVAGIWQIRTTQSLNGPTATLPVVSLLAQAIRNQGWAGNEQ